MAAINTDPATGRKIFNTRAESATNIQGSGYAPVDDEKLITMPDAPEGAIFNAEEQARYRDFKEARRGAADYMAMEGEFARYLEDYYSADPVERESLDDECEVLVVGAGFAGLLLWHKLREAGFTDVRFCEKGGDVGGTWYWNRYPGIACDVESYSYLPLLEEMGYFPTMKFASGFEIMEYCQKLAEKFGFYDHCLFHTTVDKTEWDEETQRWTVYTDRGDAMKARFVVLANGILTTPKLARINGMEKFEGDSFHTSRWNYNIDLTGKRVGIIGTGATAVQVIPEIAKVVDHLYVFQRTPSTIDVRDQRATKPEEIEAWKNEEGWPGLRGFHPAERRCRPTTTTCPARSKTSRNASSTINRYPWRNWCRSSSTPTSESWSRFGRGWMPLSRTRPRRKHSSPTIPTAASGPPSMTSTCRRSTVTM